MFGTLKSPIVKNTLTLLSLSGFLALLIVSPILLTNYFKGDKEKITIRPEINIGTEAIDCLNSDDVISVSIISPTSGGLFTNSESIAFEGDVAFKCVSLVEDKTIVNFDYLWTLNDAVIGTDISGVLDNVADIGEHRIKLKVTLKLEGITDVTKESTATFTVYKPIVVEQPPKNSLPTVYIDTPSDGKEFYVSCAYVALICTVNVSFHGSATDMEDGMLTDNSLEWFYQSPSQGKELFGSGENASRVFTQNTCGSTIYTIYLSGRDSNNEVGESSIKITITRGC